MDWQITWTASIEMSQRVRLFAVCPLGMPFKEFTARLLADDPCWHRKKPRFRRTYVNPSMLTPRIKFVSLPK